MRCSIKLCAATHLLLSVTVVIFGRGVQPIWQGLWGVVFAIEGYQGATHYQPNRVFAFLASLVVSVAFSAYVGILAIQNDTPDECTEKYELKQVMGSTTEATGENFISDACRTSYRIFAYLELLGGVCLGIVLIIGVALSCQSFDKRHALYRSGKKSSIR